MSSIVSSAINNECFLSFRTAIISNPNLPELPEDILEIIYKKMLISELEQRLMSPRFICITGKDIFRKKFNQIYKTNPKYNNKESEYYKIASILENTIVKYFDKSNIDIFFHILINVHLNGWWNYATDKYSHILKYKLITSSNAIYEYSLILDSIRSPTLIREARTKIDFETCIRHLVYMNTYGIEKYINYSDEIYSLS